MKVLKFGAVWCSGCLVMKPRWKEIEEANPWLQTEYYDFDEDKEVVEKYGINDVLPVFIFLDQAGQEFLRLNGEVSKKDLIDTIIKNKDR
ncbi:MAG: thioredoxin family protein [Candidatus Paceibacterota bacterium]|jgi:thiol-disulfide isomerase/thioredoxin